jgi:hypothetical protein
MCSGCGKIKVRQFQVLVNIFIINEVLVRLLLLLLILSNMENSNWAHINKEESIVLYSIS